MPVVKAFQAMRTRQSAIVMDLSDLEQQAANLVAVARQQAQQIMDQARAKAQLEAEEIHLAAEAAGHQEGLTTGMKTGARQGHDEAVAGTTKLVEELVARWAQSLDKFQQHFPTQLAETKDDVIRLALAIAAKVTHQEALRNCHATEQNVQAALQLVARGRNVTVNVNPQELDHLKAYLPGLLSALGKLPEVTVAPDAALAPGGCVVNFGAGQVDASLETQIERIAAELLATD